MPIDDVSTCSYNGCMTRQTKRARNPQFPLREAKNRFSELVKRAAQGERITVTVHGLPRAELRSAVARTRLFSVDWKWLRHMKVAGTQTPAEDLIRADRDARD
jgi:prevent-host-death family protein